MLAFPPLFPANYGWPSEVFIPENIHLDCRDISIELEANSYNSVLDFPTYDDIQHDFTNENSTSCEGLVNGVFTDPSMVEKKLNHNASERHRRKRVNDLYTFLRSLLPISTDQKKKVSIPGTVSRALKYIPELQKEVATFIRKKEKLSSNSLSKDYLRQQGMKNKIGKAGKNERKSSVVFSVSILGAKQAVVQLISLNDHMSKRKDIGFLSKVLEYLEEEEDGFVLISAMTFKGAGEETSFSTLHLQVQGDNSIDAERLKEKLCSFHQQLDGALH